jgi:hypothetical protein
VTTDHEDFLAARFTALASEPLPADWDDVLARAGTARTGRRRIGYTRGRSGSRRRLVVAFAVIVLVAAVTTTAWAIVRELVLDQGFVGLPPVGATSTAPESGELAVSFNGRSATLRLLYQGKPKVQPDGELVGPMTHVFVYTDGRVIWEREGGAPAGANQATSGFLERRLTTEGVELVRSRVLETGLFAHDLALTTERELPWGAIQVRTGGRLVRVEYDRRESDDGAPATPEQVRALERVDRLINHLPAWLPASAWQDPTVRAYVASRYVVCWGHRLDQVNDPEGRRPVLEPLRALSLLPRSAQVVLRRHDIVPGGSIPPEGCALVSTEEARTIARILDEAAFEGGVVGNGIDFRLWGLTYRRDAPPGHPGHIYVGFEPALPDGEWVCTACG